MNNDLYVFGNTCTLNKRRTHLNRYVPTSQSFSPVQWDAYQNVRMYQNNRRPIPAMGAFSAMHDVGTYRQVRPLVQPTGRCIHKEQMYQKNRRLIPAMGVFSAMRDVGTYRQVRPLVQPAGGCTHNERIKLITVVE